MRRVPQQHCRVSYVPAEQQTKLDKARAAFKLGGKFDTSRNEVLFAQRALLVEGYGDRIAALLLADKLGCDPDAEGITIMDCGGKSGIELVLGVCRALGVTCTVLHDEDVWPIDSITDLDKKKDRMVENEREQEKNRRLADAAGGASVFVISPSLAVC